MVGGSCYRVGYVDVLVGARLDELAADEEAHLGLQGNTSVAGTPSTATNHGEWEWAGGGNPWVRTGVEAGPSESHAADAAAVENGAAAIGDRRRPEAARGRCQGTRYGEAAMEGST